jgi:hypothetical protein
MIFKSNPSITFHKIDQIKKSIFLNLTNNNSFINLNNNQNYKKF